MSAGKQLQFLHLQGQATQEELSREKALKSFKIYQLTNTSENSKLQEQRSESLNSHVVELISNGRLISLFKKKNEIATTNMAVKCNTKKN